MEKESGQVDVVEVLPGDDGVNDGANTDESFEGVPGTPKALENLTETAEKEEAKADQKIQNNQLPSPAQGEEAIKEEIKDQENQGQQLDENETPKLTKNASNQSQVSNSGSEKSRSTDEEIAPKRGCDVDLATYNIFLRPPLIGLTDFKAKRIPLLCKRLQNYEIICLQELFPSVDKRRKIIKTQAKERGLPYSSIPKKPPIFSRFVTNAGLMNLSKFKILETKFEAYKDSAQIDALSYKGILYSKIELKPQSLLHLFNTHTQATYSGGVYKPSKHSTFLARLNQLVQLGRFIRRTLKENCYGKQGGGVKESVFVCGDFNVRANSRCHPFYVELPAKNVKISKIKSSRNIKKEGPKSPGKAHSEREIAQRVVKEEPEQESGSKNSKNQKMIKKAIFWNVKCKKAQRWINRQRETTSEEFFSEYELLLEILSDFGNDEVINYMHLGYGGGAELTFPPTIKYPDTSAHHLRDKRYRFKEKVHMTQEEFHKGDHMFLKGVCLDYIFEIVPQVVKVKGDGFRALELRYPADGGSGEGGLEEGMERGVEIFPHFLTERETLTEKLNRLSDHYMVMVRLRIRE